METNKAILLQLIKLGQMIFDQLDIKEGTYTASELAKANQVGHGNVRDIHFYLSSEESKKVVSVAYGTFKAEFEAQNIWLYIWKFEQLTGVRQSEKARFTRIQKKEEKPVCSFCLDMPKTATKMKSFVSKDNIRPSLSFVALCPEFGSMVATDRRLLRWENVTFTDYTGEPCQYIYINPKDIKDLVGRCKVEVYKDRDGYTYKTEVTNELGKVYISSCDGIQPNYKSVLPVVSKDGYVQVTKEGVKELLSFCKNAKKVYKDNTFLITLNSGSSVVSISSTSEAAEIGHQINISLCSPSNINAVICLKASDLITVSSGWTGGMWISGTCKPVIFDNSKIDGLDLVCPCFFEDASCDDIKGVAPALDRWKNVADSVQCNQDEPREKTVVESTCDDNSKEPIKNAPALYVVPKNVISEYIELLVLLIYSFRDWLYDYETAKALARLEYLAKFELSDDCMMLEGKSLKTPDLKEAEQCDAVDVDNIVCHIEDISIPNNVRCACAIFFAICLIFVAARITDVYCRLRMRVTQRIRDGTLKKGFCAK